ncbi:MAG: hypothetical protein IKA17_04480 [Clostridia bacterium]|nr:hypothetical protein [Clostridia bacterium]
MKLPNILQTRKYKKEISGFGGLNTTNNYLEGEIRECSGISHKNFPFLTQSNKLIRDEFYKSPQGIAFSQKECVIDSGALFYGKEKVGNLTSGEKEIAVMGNMILIFPDKVCYNTETKVFESLEAEYTFSDTTVRFGLNSVSVPEEKWVTDVVEDELVFFENEKLSVYSSAEITEGSIKLGTYAPVFAEEILPGTIIKDKCTYSQYRKVLSSKKDDAGKYTLKTYLYTLRNEYENVFSKIRKGDGIEISGCENEANNKILVVKEVGDHTLVFEEEALSEAQETGKITVKRKIPDFSCVCVHNNRLWGCEKNTIYASKLGDPYNFFVYRMLSTDSYSVSANSREDFNACVSYGNYCVFFKSDSIFKLYGDKPSNFQLVESIGSGIDAHGKNSLVNIGSEIFYSGIGGVYSFCGGLPSLISGKIENIKMENCSGGTNGKIYYLAADTTDGRKLFAYDMKKSLWSICGNTKIKAFSYHNGELYAIDDCGLYRFSEEDCTDDEWFVTLQPFREFYHLKKKYTKMWVSAELFENSWIKVEIKRDNGTWEQIMVRYGKNKEHITIPIGVGKCHEMMLRISGRGRCNILSIVREFIV